MTRPIKLGDYVLASHWSDCDPGDPWRVGFVVAIIHRWKPHPRLPTQNETRYLIGEADGGYTDFREYRHAKRISAAKGAAWLAEHVPTAGHP